METGIIINKKNENLSEIRIIQTEQCSTCQNKAHCGYMGKNQTILALNKINAQIGDKVKISMNETNKIILAAIFFILPVISLISGYYLGQYLNSIFNLKLIIPLCTLILFLLSFAVIKLITLLLEKKDSFYPQIIQIIN